MTQQGTSNLYRSPGVVMVLIEGRMGWTCRNDGGGGKECMQNISQQLQTKPAGWKTEEIEG
jgi:hypothetical protein